jgi:CubicO group peptidase (beta-lactamase class C family)
VRGLGVSVLAVAVVALTGCTASSRTPEELAVDVLPAVEEYLAEVDPEAQVRAVLVHHDGEPVVEHYVDSAAEDHWDTRSVTKSVVGTLIGIAIDDGHIEGVQQTLGELLPSRAAEMDDDTAAVTLHQILTHTAGFEPESAGDAYFLAEDWVAQILADRNENGSSDGSADYSNAGAHLLSAVLTEATGVPVLEYAREKLFEPLGIPTEPAFEPTVDFSDEAAAEALYEEYWDAGFTWPMDPQGVHEGACCLKLRTQDLAAIGQLYLDEGEWGGEQVVPAEWVKESTTAHVDINGAGVVGYGYLWWATEVADQPGFMAYGMGGQVIHVVPDLDLVVAISTEFDERDPGRMSTTFGQESATGLAELAVAPHLGE